MIKTSFNVNQSFEKKIIKATWAVNIVLFAITPLWLLLQSYSFIALLAHSNFQLPFFLIIIINVSFYLLIVYLLHMKGQNVWYYTLFVFPLFLTLFSDYIAFVSIVGILIALPVNAIFFVLLAAVMIFYFSSYKDTPLLAATLFLSLAASAIIPVELLIADLIRSNLF